jgi:hypothetical protein
LNLTKDQPLRKSAADSKPVVKGIRLKPSATDYATIVRRTSQVLGDTGPASHKTRPNRRYLSLFKVAS